MEQKDKNKPTEDSKLEKKPKSKTISKLDKSLKKILTTKSRN